MPSRSTECHYRSHTLGVWTSRDPIGVEQGAHQAKISIHPKIEIAGPYNRRPIDQLKHPLIDVSVFHGTTFFQPAILGRN